MSALRFVATLLLVAACSNGSTPAPATPAAPVATAPVAEPIRVVPGAKSTVATKKFKSEALGVEKSYVVYLPAGYDANPNARYPVFYYLHGLGGNETNWSEGGELDETADRMGLQAIVVMPDGDDGFYVDGVAPIDYDKCMADGTGLFIPHKQPKGSTCVRARKYSTYITSDLIAHVDATYRTIATRDGRAIAGLSMGGFGALQLSMRHPQLFAAAASHSGVDSLMFNGPIPYQKGKVNQLTDPRTWGGPFIEINRWMRGLFGDDLERWRAHDPTTLVNKLEPGQLALYLDCGTEDEFMLQHGASWLHDLLLDRKIDHEWYLGPGNHTFDFWKVRVAESLRYLRDHTTKAR